MEKTITVDPVEILKNMGSNKKDKGDWKSRTVPINKHGINNYRIPKIK